MVPSQDECDYVTVDDVMLLYHIEVQHPELESFKCKNCDPALDPISFAGTDRVHQSGFGLKILLLY